MEEPEEVDEKTVPTVAVVKSLRMKVRMTSEGKWSIKVPELVDAIVGDTWEEAYWKTRKALRG